MTGVLNVELSDDHAAEIRSRYRIGGITQWQIAEEYGISQGHVSRIIRGEARTGSRARPPLPQPSIEDLSTERWITARAYPDYEVSTLGRVRRVSGGIGARAGHILRPRPATGGYVTVALRVKGKRHEVLLHHLVLESFIGPRPDGMEGCHKNATPPDCRLSNLRWDTREANIQDKIDLRLSKSCGEGHILKWTPNGKLSDGTVKRALTCADCRRAKSRDRYYANKDAANG